ncbi:MAG: ferredoxin reductase family protein [Anaeromyxobacter sp.]
MARSGLWVGLYILLALYPLLWLAASPLGTRGFQQELGAALGFLALSTMAMQFALTARFSWMAPPFGTDLVYAFHRYITAAAILFAALHPLFMLDWDVAWVAQSLIPSGWYEASLAAGVLALYALILLAVTSFWRRQLRLAYEPWRYLHIVFAVLAVCLGLWHAVSSKQLLGNTVSRVMWVTWTLLWAGLIVRVRVLKPLLLLRRPYKVTGVRKEHGGAVTLVLDPDGHDGFRFRAGQFAWLTLGRSPFAGAEHPFSISGSAQRAPRVELTIRALGDFTRAVQETRPGTRAYVDGPFGSMSLDAVPDADRYFFVAGGIGIAPCVSMLRTLADRGDRRPHTIVYGTLDWEHTPLREELAELASRLDLKVVHVLEKPPLGWLGEVGIITQDLLDRHLPRSGRRVCFICGPPRMMDATERALARLDVPLEDIHSERFDLV